MCHCHLEGGWSHSCMLKTTFDEGLSFLLFLLTFLGEMEPVMWLEWEQNLYVKIQLKLHWSLSEYSFHVHKRFIALRLGGTTPTMELEM